MTATRRIAAWWRGRSPRERRLIALLGLLLLPVLGWLAVVRPMTDATIAARTALVAATRTHDRFATEVAAITARRRALSADRTGRRVAVDLMAAQALGERGIAVGAITTISADAASLTIEAVAPVVLMNWLAELEAADIITTSARIAPVAAAPGVPGHAVTATIRLERARP